MNRKLLVFLSGFLIILSSILGVGTAFAAGKTKIVYAYMDNCRMCRLFEYQVLDDPEVRSALANVTFEKVNARSGRVKVAVTPTLIIYQDGVQVRKLTPTLNKNDFLEIIREYE